MTTAQLSIMFFVCVFSSFYLGMRYDSHMWRKRYRRAVRVAWRRGWDAGFGFLNRIEDAKTEEVSSVRVIDSDRKRTHFA